MSAMWPARFDYKIDNPVKNAPLQLYRNSAQSMLLDKIKKG